MKGSNLSVTQMPFMVLKVYCIISVKQWGMTMKQIKFANKWYKVHDVKFSLGMNWYKIEDEPNHFDWISENSIEGYR